MPTNADGLKRESDSVMKKVLIFLTLTLVLLICFVSCDGQDEHTHNFGEWSVTKNATCTENGVKTRYCECGEKQSDDIAAIGHNFIDNVCTNCSFVSIVSCKHDDPTKIAVCEAKNPTCQETGLTEGMKCLNCKTMVVPQMVIPITECTDLKTLPYQAPTCQMIGLTEGKQCNICGSMVVSQTVIPVTECTDLKVLPYHDPTCQETGLSEGKQCNICGTIVVEQDILHKINCDESDWIIDKKATKTEDGSKHTECIMCGRKMAEETIPAGSVGLTYALNNDSLSYSVIGIGTCTDTDIIIPGTYNKLPVTAIGKNAFEDCYELTSVLIPDSVTSIGDYAFYCCTNLTGIVIPDNVTSVGKYAFYRCSNCCSVVIGKGVTSIEYATFMYCGSLSSVVIGDNVTSIGDSAFNVCDSLNSVVIPDSVTRIGENAFNCCYSLSSVVIGDSVTSISKFAFSNCDTLTSVVIPNSVTRIGDYAFYFSGLEDVYYTGSEEEWKAITIGSYNSDLKNATIHYNYVPEN